MNSNLYKKIDSLADEQSRTEVTAYLKEQLPALSSDLSQAIETAYRIAGLMATKFAHSLNDSDPIDEILTIAGELEISPENAEELREELISKIQALI